MSPVVYESVIFMSKAGDDGCPREISLTENVVGSFAIVCLFESESYYVAQAGTELPMPQLHPLK